MITAVTQWGNMNAFLYVCDSYFLWHTLAFLLAHICLCEAPKCE